MPGMLQTIATAFEELPRQATTLQDITHLQGRLGGPKPSPSFVGVASGAAQTMLPSPLTFAHGTVYVHNRRTDESRPVVQPLARTGVPTVDATFHKRSEMLMQEMASEFSKFSLAGLAWAEQQARDEATLDAERAAEDAAIAKKRFEEDAAIAARRAQQDGERSQHDGVAGTSFRASRDEEVSALSTRWRTKFAELAASLEEALLAHEQQLALDEQRRKEEEARMQEKATREAQYAAERAKGHAELAEDARRLAELAALRLATTPSLRSLALVSCEHVAPAIGYACPVAGTPLRLHDRSWWKCLHLLEAEGLTPPLKATEYASGLFHALDDDADDAVVCADAGYLLALLTTGSTRDRIDAACDAPGAPGGGLTVTSAAAARQLQLCARARKMCAPKLTALLRNVSTADTTAMVPVPAADSLERSVATLFAGTASIPADRFRQWAATTPTVATLFAPLSRY